MNDPEIASPERLVAALRTNDPNALAALFDAYADRLFRYCWFLLRNRDIAQIALRDAMVAAQAHIGRLADPGALSSWLYALARTECRRHRPVPAAEADEPPARPSQPDADSRLMAWQAVSGMDAAETEALELTCRHDVDLGRVLGMSAPDARALLDRARRDLERALGAEIVVSRGSLACPDRAEVMRGWAGTVTPQVRECVLRHAAECPVCGPSLPRNVSAARVFALLPVLTLPSGARARVLDFAADPRTAGHREFTVARTADAAGPGHPRGSRAVQVLAATAVAVAAAAVASMIVLGGGPGGSRGPGRLNPAAGGAGPSAPQRESAGDAGALPSEPRPTGVPTSLPPVPRTAATIGVTRFTTLTRPLPAIPRPGPPPVPPRVPGGLVCAVPSAPTPAGSLTVTPSTWFTRPPRPIPFPSSSLSSSPPSPPDPPRPSCPPRPPYRPRPPYPPRPPHQHRPLYPPRLPFPMDPPPRQGPPPPQETFPSPAPPTSATPEPAPSPVGGEGQRVYRSGPHDQAPFPAGRWRH